METVGEVVGGSVSGKILIRLHSEKEVDVGDLLISTDAGGKYYIKIVDTNISSQIGSQFIEDISGQKLEYDMDYNIFDEKDRFYRLCHGKILKVLKDGQLSPPRSIPHYFSSVHRIKKEDLDFLDTNNGVRIGKLRLGRRVLDDVIISLPTEKLISHHMLVVAATGKGKSNFAKVFIRGLLSAEKVAGIVLDPHGEYYGERGTVGLSADKRKDKILFFTPRFKSFPGSEQLKLYAEDLAPWNFFGIIELTDAQREAMDTLYRKYGQNWLKNLITELSPETIVSETGNRIQLVTIYALKRRLSYIMELENDNGLVFTLRSRKDTSVFDKIKRAVREEKVVIIDTNLVGDEAEKLIASSIVNQIFGLYRRTKQSAPDKFKLLPELLLVFEEAPRVLGASSGSNIFGTVAREGRKFKIGLCAITQMPSLLPREVLSQMNTKVILGLPAPSDREAVINSSSQNIEDESTEIQMLDTGEALITSPFLKFPIPVKVDYFDKMVKDGNSEVFNTRGIG